MRITRLFAINIAIAILLASLAVLKVPTIEAKPPAATQWNIQTISSDYNVGQFSSIALDSSDYPRISYYDASNLDLKYISGAGDAWYHDTVDAIGNVGLFTSIALDSADKVHISYYDSFNGSNGDLKYATNAGGLWDIATVDSFGDVGQYTSLALDSANKVHISYYDYTNSNLKYATNAGGSWSATTVDNVGDVGEHTSIAVDTWGKVHISYFDASNSDLKYATNAGGPWSTTTIDYIDSVGRHTSIALDSANKVYISYYDGTNGNLKYATNTGGSWSISTVDSVDDVGLWTSLALDSANKAHISYFDYTNGNLKYATNSGGLWSITIIDSDGIVGVDSSIALDSADKAHISYYDATYTAYDLKYAAEVSEPSAPQNLQAVVGDSSVDLSWSVPWYRGPGALTYHLFRDGIEEYGGPALSYHDAALTNGVQYSYKVAAQNSVGWSQNSSSVTATPQPTATVPSAPQNLTATAGDSQITLTWAAPADDGGSPITNYTVYDVSGDDSVLINTLGNVLTCTVGSLNNGQTYYFLVKAMNLMGEGSASNEVSATPQATVTVPSAPQSLTVTAGDSQITLAWSAPFDDGGAPIIAYKVYRGTTSGGETLLTQLSNVAAYIDNNLTNGQTYHYKVSAVNAVGEGPPCGEMSATPSIAVTVPSAPQGLQASPGDAFVNLTWQPPSSDGGSTITHYHIWGSTAPGSEVLVAIVPDRLWFNDTGLTNGLTYYYKVSAENDRGQGANSSEVSATPGQTAIVPSAPQNLVAVAGDGSVTLSWDIPDGNCIGNCNYSITAYHVYRGTSAGSLSMITTLYATDYIDANVTNGQTYHYKVSAINSAGEGTMTAEVSATPQSSSASGGDNAFLYIGVGVAAVAIIVALAYLLWRRKK